MRNRTKINMERHHTSYNIQNKTECSFYQGHVKFIERSEQVLDMHIDRLWSMQKRFV